MFKLSALSKWLIVLLLGFGGGGAVVLMSYQSNPGYSIFQYPQSIYQSIFKKPKAPQIVDQKKEGGCGTRVWWVDNALDEDGVRFDRRIIGQPNFVTVQITGPHAGMPGSFDESNLPEGTYEYRVGVFNGYGTTYSNLSAQIAIPASCGNAPLPILPLNPVITSIELLKNSDCVVRVHYNDNSNDEDGIRVYRSEWNDPDVLIDTLPANNAPSGMYDDTTLIPGHYTYQLSVFNANGEAFSQLSDEIEITADMCSNAAVAQPANPNQVFIVTSTPTPVPNARVCTWKAKVNVFVRKGPGASIYPEITAVEAGAELPVMGQSEDVQFWAVKLNTDVMGYVPKAEKFGLVAGDCANIPIVKDPARPPTPVPTKVPPQAPSTPRCSDGIDNDGDGAIDLRDRGCSSANDNSE